MGGFKGLELTLNDSGWMPNEQLRIFETNRIESIVCFNPTIEQRLARQWLENRMTRFYSNSSATHKT